VNVRLLFSSLGTHSGGMDAACYNECGAKDFCYNYFIYMILYSVFKYCFRNIIIIIYYTFFIPVYLQTMLGGIAHNVPAVCDVFAARIRALRSKDQGRQNVGGVRRGSGAKRNDLAERNPEPPTGGEA
jgi:hypothetical protein